jgi:hypothetical protein
MHRLHVAPQRTDIVHKANLLPIMLSIFPQSKLFKSLTGMWPHAPAQLAIR